MKFKATKIAAAVAATMGVSAVGISTAQADALLFPYFAVSDTVTSVVTVINTAKQGIVSDVSPQTLHYRFYYKSGSNAESLSAECEEFDVRRVTSPNDVVTFDLLGRYGDELGILAEPAARQQKANYTEVGQSFALMKGLTPARGFMMVDNDEDVNDAGAGYTLFGEIAVIDFAGGAIWGYKAYNPGPPRGVTVADVPPSGLNFEDASEINGEVLAGDRSVTENASRGGKSALVPVGIMPLPREGADGEVITKFFVTPIGHAVSIDDLASPRIDGWQNQDNKDLTTRLKLQVEFDDGTPNDVMFDRDENPVSGQMPQDVTCVGAVEAGMLLSAGARREVEEFGGWSAVQIESPGSLASYSADAIAGTTVTRERNTNQAIVIKLEYNPDGSFLGETFSGSFNNAMWLRYSYRESINCNDTGDADPDSTCPPGVLATADNHIDRSFERLLIRSIETPLGPVDVSNTPSRDASAMQ